MYLRTMGFSSDLKALLKKNLQRGDIRSTFVAMSQCSRRKYKRSLWNKQITISLKISKSSATNSSMREFQLIPFRKVGKRSVLTWIYPLRSKVCTSKRYWMAILTVQPKDLWLMIMTCKVVVLKSLNNPRKVLSSKRIRSSQARILKRGNKLCHRFN